MTSYATLLEAALHGTTTSAANESGGTAPPSSGTSGSVGSVDWVEVASLVLAADLHRTSSSDVVTLLEGLRPEALRDLDGGARGSWLRAAGWADDAEQRLASGQAGLLGAVVASFHPSGYVRQDAVSHLRSDPSPLATKALVLRSADWVIQVRTPARKGLRARLETADGFLAAAPLALLLGPRQHGAWLVGRLASSVDALSDAALARVLACDDRRTRRLVHRAAIGGHRLSVDVLLRSATTEPDPVVAAWCADGVLRAARDAGDMTTAEPLLHSRLAAVRRDAVHAFGVAGRADVAAAALLDRTRAVREVAQAGVRRAGGDPATTYRQLAETSHSSGGASDAAVVSGLGETGGRDDALLIRARLDDPRPGVRAAAVRALRLLDAALPTELLALLDDPYPGVVSQVVDALKPDARRLPVERLTALLDPARPTHVRRGAYLLLRARGPVSRVLTDLELLDDDDRRLRRRALSDLISWGEVESAHSYASPSPGERARLAELIHRHLDLLGRDRARGLGFVLGLAPRSQQGEGRVGVQPCQPFLR